MTNSTDPAAPWPFALSRTAKLRIVAAVLLICTAVIADNFRRYHGGPTQEELAARARDAKQSRIEAIGKQPWNVVWKNQTAANNIAAHTRLLEDLRVALAPQPVSRCTPSTRRALRSAFENYMSLRAGAVKLAKREPIAKDLGLDKVWETDDDAQALADAKSLLNKGYLVASELTAWSDDEAAILSLPMDVASACARSINAADPGEIPSAQ